MLLQPSLPLGIVGDDTFQAADGLVDAGLVQPGLSVLIQVDAGDGLAQPVGEEHLAKVLPLGEVGHAGVARQIVPTHRLELLLW